MLISIVYGAILLSGSTKSKLPIKEQEVKIGCVSSFRLPDSFPVEILDFAQKKFYTVGTHNKSNTQRIMITMEHFNPVLTEHPLDSAKQDVQRPSNSDSMVRNHVDLLEESVVSLSNTQYYQRVYKITRGVANTECIEYQVFFTHNDWIVSLRVAIGDTKNIPQTVDNLNKYGIELTKNIVQSWKWFQQPKK